MDECAALAPPLPHSSRHQHATRVVMIHRSHKYHYTHEVSTARDQLRSCRHMGVSTCVYVNLHDVKRLYTVI